MINIDRLWASHKILKDLAGNVEPIPVRTDNIDDFHWYMYVLGVNYSELVKQKSFTLWDDYRYETQALVWALSISNGNLLTPLTDAPDANSLKSKILTIHSNPDKHIKSLNQYQDPKSRGILWPKIKNSKNLSPTFVYTTNNRASNIYEYLKSTNTPLGTIVEIGSGTDTNLVKMAESPLPGNPALIGIDYLTLEDAMREETMRGYWESNSVDQHRTSHKKNNIRHLVGDMRALEDLDIEVKKLRRPLMVLFSNVLRHITTSSIRRALGSSVNYLQPEYIFVNEGISPIGLRYPDSKNGTFKKVYKLY